jgi:hypothetical protein
MGKLHLDIIQTILIILEVKVIVNIQEIQNIDICVEYLLWYLVQKWSFGMWLVFIEWMVGFRMGLVLLIIFMGFIGGISVVGWHGICGLVMNELSIFVDLVLFDESFDIFEKSIKPLFLWGFLDI